jgi:hypothetical protein
MERQTVNAVLAYNDETFDLPESIKKIESSLSSCQLALWLILFLLVAGLIHHW